MINKILEIVPSDVCGCKNIDILDPNAWNAMVKSVQKNGTFCPGVERIIYNVGTKNDRKVLTTVVFFKDGTKCSVTNSERDGVKFEDAFTDTVKIDETGKSYIEKTPLSFQTATHESKEIGLVYCLVKRMLGAYEIDEKTGKETGLVIGNGFGRKLNDFVDAAYDTQIEDAKRKAARAAAKAEYEATKGTAKPKRKRESLAKTIDRLTDILDALQSRVK